MINYWIMKTEPDVLSIDTLAQGDKKTSCWDGVRNYQARNYMRDLMKCNDLVLIYHSNANPSGVAGMAKITREFYPDHTQWDKKSQYFDPKSSQKNPRWGMVDVTFVEKFKRFISLEEMKKHTELTKLRMLQKGNRLSITPIDESEFKYICTIAR